MSKPFYGIWNTFFNYLFFQVSGTLKLPLKLRTSAKNDRIYEHDFSGNNLDKKFIRKKCTLYWQKFINI